MTAYAAELTRASGIVAGVLVVVALCSGFLFSARETGARRRPAWWLDLHNGLGGLAWLAIVLHVGASVFDRDAAVGVVEVFVPGVAATSRWPLAWGVIALYLVTGALFTTWPRRIENRRTWRIVHLGSTAAVALALVHGYQMGSDASRVVFQIGLVLLAAPAVYALSVRGLDALRPTRRP